MKKTMKNVVAVGCCAVLITAWGVLPASAGMSDAYYSYPMPETAAVLAPSPSAPVDQANLTGGPSGMRDAYYSYPMASKPVGEANLAEIKLGPSKAYYDKHPTTVEDLEKVWGKPLAVKHLKDGREERYYKDRNTWDLGYRAFLVKDGKVIASGLTRDKI